MGGNLADSARLFKRRRAAQAHGTSVPGGDLPGLILMTDPLRLLDVEAAVRRLPRGSAVILRHYTEAERAALARRLAALARVRRVRLLVAGDERLALAVGAGGLHLPEGMARRRALAKPGCHPKRPGFLVTAAAHSPMAVARAARAGADAVLLSPVFATASHPRARPLGVVRFARMCRAAALPVFALGGVDGAAARRLKGTGCAGIAAIGALAEVEARRQA